MVEIRGPNDTSLSWFGLDARIVTDIVNGE
jgi:hypothetical protein